MQQRLARSVLLALSWGLVTLLTAGCGLFRVPSPAPPDPPAPPPVPAPAPAPVVPSPRPVVPPPDVPPPALPVDVEAVVIQAVAQDLGVSEGFIRAYLAAAGIDVAARLAAAGVGPDGVEALIAEARARGVGTPAELQAFIIEVSRRPPS